MADAASDEPALMARVANGDARAFRVLAERHTPGLLMLARRIVGTPAEAEDVVQETLLRLWQHAGRWQADKGAPAAWLTRIANNLAVDRVRRRTFWPLDTAIEVADPTPGADALLSDDQQRARIAAAIAALPARQRAAIALFYDAALPGAEVAATLGVTQAGLWALLHRARRSLSARLADLLANK